MEKKVEEEEEIMMMLKDRDENKPHSRDKKYEQHQWETQQTESASGSIRRNTELAMGKTDSFQHHALR